MYLKVELKESIGTLKEFSIPVEKGPLNSAFVWFERVGSFTYAVFSSGMNNVYQPLMIRLDNIHRIIIASEYSGISPESVVKAITLIHNNEYINAVKVIREELGHLAEAKSFCDKIRFLVKVKDTEND